jgi:hypothetical protein
MTIIHKLAVASALVLAMAAPQVFAQSSELRPIGRVQFEPEPFEVQNDVFQIRPEDRRIRSMRIQARGGAADVRNLVVTYGDGRRETVRVRQSLSDGDRSALFRLNEPRPVRSVEISYVPRGPVTLVLLADSRRQPVAEWRELGCKSVGFLVDRDVIRLDTEDRFRALRLRSSGFAIRLEEMGVRYGNGVRDRYVIQTTIPSNGRTGQIDLRGEARRIREIDFIYGSGVISNVKTRLCVDGLALESEEE